MGRRLMVVGDGPGRAALEAQAPTHVTFTGRVSDAELADLYARCRALVFPGEEDFGLVPVEAQAAGRPVIAFGRGGARESVRDESGGAATGVWFEAQTPESLIAAVERFEARESEFDPRVIRTHAEQFGAERFRSEILGEIDAALNAPV